MSPPPCLAEVNQEMIIDVKQILNNTIITVFQEAKTKCSPVIIVKTKELTSTQLSHCHCYVAPP